MQYYSILNFIRLQRIFFFIGIFFLILPRQIKCQTNYKGLLQYQFPLLTEYPPLTTGMPYDVLMTYIYGDSLARNTNGKQVDSIINTLGISDTFQYAIKYLYETENYNPISLYQWEYTDPAHRYYRHSYNSGATPGGIFINLKNLIHRTIQDTTGATELLCRADYIADVIVNSTQEGINSSASEARHHVLVTCTVNDPIKGQCLPDCIYNNSQIGGIKQNNKIIYNATGGCLQFEYALEWPRISTGLLRFDSTGSPYLIYNDSILGDTSTGPSGYRWIEPNSEYIVFLQLVYEHPITDTMHAYALSLPECWFGSCDAMYPVRNGYVYDPTNDFGFGSNLTISQWKTALRQKIYSLINPY